MRHTMVQPLPMVEKSSEGVLEVPEDIHCWKGSVFSIFSRSVANWDSSGYGALLQTPSVSVSPVVRPYKVSKGDCVLECFITSTSAPQDVLLLPGVRQKSL